MELIRGLHNIKAKHHGCVLTIGKFDGVHLGHQAVLKNVLKTAKELDLPAVVMVFEPQPEEMFAPENAPARLSPLRDKYTQLAELGVHSLLCVRFSRHFAGQVPQEFIQNYLLEKLGVKFLVIGDDFRFGANRSGDFAFLKREGKRLGFDVASTASFCLQDNRISSTAIRQALAASNFALAKDMLGRIFCIKGRVVKGEQNGRKIGFPTANILIKRQKSPLTGVFAVQVLYKNRVYNGVANVGMRPTLNGRKTQLEAHIFEFNEDIYGQELAVEFVAKIRDERKFSSLEELTKQIEIDAQQARHVLKQQ